MPNGSKHTSLADDDDNILEQDEDDTAKLSNDRRSGKGKDSDSNGSSSTLQRVKSLTERNRKVLYFFLSWNYCLLLQCATEHVIMVLRYYHSGMIAVLFMIYSSRAYNCRMNFEFHLVNYFLPDVWACVLR